MESEQLSILTQMTIAKGNKHEKGATNQQKELDADTNFGKKADNYKQIFMTNKKSNRTRACTLLA